MSIEQEVADLTTATTNLLNAVNVKKVILDAAVDSAEADRAASDTARISAEAARTQSQLSAELAAGSAGVQSSFDTYAAANAALGSIAANALIAVLADENKNGQGTYYRKTGGVLVFTAYISSYRKPSEGVAQLTSYPRGSVIVHVGDSNTQKPGYRNAYEGDWLARGGVFESWASYNHGANGQTANGYANGIASGNQSEAPFDYPAVSGGTSNPWQTVNANPQVIIYSLGTNDMRIGAGSANIAAKTASLRADVARLVNFFLEKTSAAIILRMPPPIAFANPDPGGFTDCLDANDAAARSAAIRTVYLEWLNVSDRVRVIDLHKHLFGLRADSVAGPQDPEGSGNLMSDTLHPSDLGFTRSVQIIARSIDPSLPYTSKTTKVGIDVFDAALWTYTVRVADAGNGYIDFQKDPTALPTVSSGTLANVRLRENLLFSGTAAKFKEFSRLGANFSAFSHKTGATLTFTAVPNLGDRPLNGEWRLLATGDFTSIKNDYLTFYVTNPTSLPDATLFPNVAPISIVLNGTQPLGAGAAGAAIDGYSRGSFAITGVRGVRAGNSGAVSIDIYRVGGAVPGATYATGDRIGNFQFRNGYYRDDLFTVDATNYPSGLPSFGLSGNESAFYAVVVSGTIGAYGEIKLMKG